MLPATQAADMRALKAHVQGGLAQLRRRHSSIEGPMAGERSCWLLVCLLLWRTLHMPVAAEQQCSSEIHQERLRGFCKAHALKLS